MQAYSTADVGTPLARVKPFTRIRKGCSPKKLVYARRMRKHPTRAEDRLWQALRTGCAGFRFRNQAIILGWIADFYCPAAGLVVEVDGGIHARQRAYDRRRTRAMGNIGIHVVRFTNQEVLHDVDKVIAHLSAMLRAGGLPKPPRRRKPGGHIARFRVPHDALPPALAPYHLRCPCCDGVVYWLKSRPFTQIGGIYIDPSDLLHPDGTPFGDDEPFVCECHPRAFASLSEYELTRLVTSSR